MVNHLSFFGLGKLGLPLAALFARSGLRTSGIDLDVDLVHRLQAGELAHCEPGLEEILAQAAALTFATDASVATESNASIVLVDTPSDTSGPAFSAVQVEEACRSLCRALKMRPAWRYHLVVIASTLFPGTIATSITRLLEEELGRRAGKDFGLAYVPDFVALGEVVQGFQKPPFLLIGSDDQVAGAQAATLFQRVVAPGTPLRILSARDAELTKIFFNVFLCMKISYGNFIAQLGDRLGGADLDAIAETVSLDPRIGVGLLRGGAPYAGPCLPRDIDALDHLAQSMGLNSPLVSAASETNSAQYDLIERHVVEGHPRCVAVLGLSFKAGTPVTIGSSGFEFAKRFLSRSLRVVAFDPAAKPRADARKRFGAAISCFDALEDCLREADTILVCNADPCFSGIATSVSADHRIVDPWGCVRGSHPGLIRIGRKSPDVQGNMSALTTRERAVPQ